ncbi:N/A [soil metagenome]
MNVGIIGAGRWAEVHKQALEDVGASLEAVLVSSQTSKQRVEDEWKVRATTDMQTFLNEDTEVVIVVSPNYLHAEHAVAALNAGKHVLVEKPMATTLSDCEAMLAAAERADKVLAVGLEMRVFTLFERVKHLLDADRIGKPLHLKLDLWRRPYRTGAGGWKQDPTKLGSAILEEPVHYLDLARWYLSATSGEPVALQAWANSRAGREYLSENLDIRLEYADKMRALITRSIAAFEHRVNLQIVGETGSLRAEWAGALDLDEHPTANLWLHTSGDRDAPAERLEVEQKTGHAFDVQRQTAAFLEAIRNGTFPPATGADGFASVALSLAVERSLEEGSSVVNL